MTLGLFAAFSCAEMLNSKVRVKIRCLVYRIDFVFIVISLGKIENALNDYGFQLFRYPCF